MSLITQDNVHNLKPDTKIIHIYCDVECTFVRWDDSSPSIGHIIDNNTKESFPIADQDLIGTYEIVD